MRSIRRWTAEEEDLLREMWGHESIESIAKTLDRSVTAVLEKKYRLKVPRFFESGDYVTLNCLCNCLLGKNVHSYIMKSWVENRGLPVHMKRRSRKCRVRIVYLDEFWKWAEQNRSFVDFSRLEPLALGKEPEWVAAQRSKDFQASALQRKDPWTPAEDMRLRFLISQFSYTWADLAKELSRSEGAIQRRINDLKIYERPLRVGPHDGKWTPELVEILKAGILDGDPYALIAQKINKSEKAVRGYVWRIYHTEIADKIRQIIRNEPERKEQNE